jgi:hypothetical protein
MTEKKRSKDDWNLELLLTQTVREHHKEENQTKGPLEDDTERNQSDGDVDKCRDDIEQDHLDML